MKKVLSAIAGFFRRLFSKETADALNSALQEAAPYVEMALPIVRQIAALTPTRTDDLILAAYDAYGLKDLWDSSKPKDVMLRDLAVAVVRNAAKTDVASRILVLAVELAYSTYRKEAAANISAG